MLIEPVSTMNSESQPLSPPKTERCSNCSGAGKVGHLMTIISMFISIRLTSRVKRIQMDEKIAGLFLSHPSNGDQSKLGIPVCSELGVFMKFLSLLQVMCPTCLCTGMEMASEHDPRIDPFD